MGERSDASAEPVCCMFAVSVGCKAMEIPLSSLQYSSILDSLDLPSL